jgi:hypothetical protein
MVTGGEGAGVQLEERRGGIVNMGNKPQNQDVP